MNKLLSVLFFLSPVFSLAQDKAIAIRVLQHDEPVTIQNGVLQLEKKPFQIEVKLTNLEGVYLSAGFNDSIYRIGFQEPVPGFSDLPAMTVAETEMNKDQTLMTTGDGWSYWFYDRSMDWHRFDKEVKLIDGENVLATKTVRQFFMGNKKSLKVEKVKDPLYLVFLTAEKDKDGNPVKELERIKLKIDWK